MGDAAAKAETKSAPRCRAVAPVVDWIAKRKDCGAGWRSTKMRALDAGGGARVAGEMSGRDEILGGAACDD